VDVENWTRPARRRYAADRKARVSPEESVITHIGQVTIPKAIRDHLRLRAGDRVKFFLHPDGRVVLLPKVPVTVLRGFVKTGARAVTLEAMTDVAAGGACARYRRSRSMRAGTAR
jgi:antitoxin PrlF